MYFMKILNFFEFWFFFEFLNFMKILNFFENLKFLKFWNIYENFLNFEVFGVCDIGYKRYRLGTIIDNAYTKHLYFNMIYWYIFWSVSLFSFVFWAISSNTKYKRNLEDILHRTRDQDEWYVYHSDLSSYVSDCTVGTHSHSF